MNILSDEVRRVALSTIEVDRANRQREDLDGIEELAASIRDRGLYHPIIISRDYKLIAGERRLEATRLLGQPDILCRFVDSLSETERQIVELEENIKRKDLEWRELVKAMSRIHKLYVELDASWTMTQTAASCHVSLPLVSNYLRIASEIDDPRISEANTYNEALNILRRRDQRAAGDALMELIELPAPSVPASSPLAQLDETSGQPIVLPAVAPAPYGEPSKIVRPIIPSAEETILCEDFLAWAPKYEGRKFNFIHCDFPYGIDVFSGPQARGSDPSSGYGDSQALYERLIETLCKNLDRLMSISAHMMFWYSDKHRDLTRRMFNKLAPSLEIHPYPLIWLKSDNAGIASDPTRGPRHIYETALFITRGKRNIVRVVSDAYASPTEKSLHPSTKPEPMLRHFFTMLVDGSTTMLDPTCGSGASIRAAESLEAKSTLGLEIDS